MEGSSSIRDVGRWNGSGAAGFGSSCFARIVLIVWISKGFGMLPGTINRDVVARRIHGGPEVLEGGTQAQTKIITATDIPFFQHGESSPRDDSSSMYSLFTRIGRKIELHLDALVAQPLRLSMISI